MEYYHVKIASEHIIPKLQTGTTYLYVSQPKYIEDLVKENTELRKRRHPNFYDFYTITQPGTFISVLTTIPHYYKKLEPVEKPPSPFEQYYDATELRLATSKRLPIVSPNAVLFPHLSDCNKDMIRMLNIVNMFQFIDADGLLLYRQSNVDIHVTKDDLYHILEVPDMRTTDQLRLDESYIKPFTKKPFVYEKISGTICDHVLTVKDPYDILIVNLNIFKYLEQDDTEYRNVQSYLSIATQLTNLLKKGGTFLFHQYHTYLKISNDFFHILSHMFDSVYLTKTINENTIHPNKTMVCTGFRANKEFEKTIRILYESWLRLDASCGMKLGGTIIQRLLGGSPSIKSIQAIQTNDLQLSIKTLQIIEERIKMPEQIPVYIEEAKLEAKHIYDLMKVHTPITLLYKPADLKRMFYQPPILNIVVKRSNNRNRLLHSEFNDIRRQIESNLFVIKRQIDYVSDLDKYAKVTDLFKISNRVLKYSAQKIIGQPVSQAFLKMCELLHHTELVSTKKIDVFHLCEAPGQFILAFQHYCDHKKIDYKWTATTLKKNDDGTLARIFDTYGLIRKYPTQWVYGADDTGNITHLVNIRSFAKKQYDIVTSDCGLPTEEFGFQEEQLLQINHGQLTAMLLCLKVGGNCVFKTFLPLIFPLNLSLFHILYIHFEKVIYFKPSLNPSSSEIYVLGINFKGLSKPVEDALCHVVQRFNPNQWLFTTFEKDFIKFHIEAVQACIENTKKSIYRSILMYHYYNPKEHDELLKRIQHKEGDAWIKKYLLFKH
jgi:hypothetical protein